MHTLTAIVSGNNMQDTISVKVAYEIKHPKYHKVMKRTSKLLVHNELAGVNIGDLVRIAQSRPYSKNVHFIVTEIVEHRKVDITADTKVDTKVTPKEEAKPEVKKQPVKTKAKKK